VYFFIFLAIVAADLNTLFVLLRFLPDDSGNGVHHSFLGILEALLGTDGGQTAPPSPS
jgi:hypothetical protein